MNESNPVVNTINAFSGTMASPGPAARRAWAIGAILWWVGAVWASNPTYQCEIDGQRVVLRSNLSTWMPSAIPGCIYLRDDRRLLLPHHPPQPRPFDWPVMLNARPAAEAVDDDEPAAAPDIRHTVTQHAQKNGLHPDLVLAVIQAESAFNPLARSPKGALGLMQVMPTTARDYGVDKPEALLTAEQNIRVGTVHLARLVRKFGGDIPLALAAYNAGEGAVMRSGWRIPPYPETERYVQKVMRSWAGEEEGGRP